MEQLHVSAQFEHGFLESQPLWVAGVQFKLYMMYCKVVVRTKRERPQN